MAEEIKITEWLQKVKEDPKQAGAPFLAIAALGFLVHKFFYAPKALLITKEEKKSKSIINEMRNFKDAASRLEDIKIDIEDKKKNWENTQKLCYKELERTQFMRRVREIASKANINVKSVNPLQDESISIGALSAKKFSVTFSYNDNLAKLLTFMRLVELEPKICFMPVPDLSPTASGTFDTSLTVSTILLPDVIEIDSNEDEGDEDEGDEDY